MRFVWELRQLGAACRIADAWMFRDTAVAGALSEGMQCACLFMDVGLLLWNCC
jgi:hypothetical protein